MAPLGRKVTGIVGEIRRLATMAAPTSVPRVIVNDADDDQVLACALADNAGLIVSGDQHLHSLGGEYQGIRIVTPTEAVRWIS